MHRFVQMRRMLLSLTLAVALLGAAAGAALWHTLQPIRSLAAPSMQTNSFQVDQLQLQYERFIEALWRFSAGELDAAGLSLRLDILASRLAPARQLSGIDGLPGPSATLQAMAERIDAWTPVVADLRDGEAGSRARAVALIGEVRGLRDQVQDMVVETNRAFGEQRDHERLQFFERFRWLLMAIAALASGVALLVAMLWRQLKRSSRLGETLAEPNLTLEDRVVQRTAQLHERERQVHAILDASPIAVALLRLADHGVVFANQRFRRRFAAPTGAPGAPMPFNAIFVDEAGAADFWRAFQIAQSLEDHEVELNTADGRAGGWSLVSVRPLVVGGEPVLLFWAYDITTRKELESELRQLAHTDPLTGVLNRRAFTERSAQCLAAARRQQRPLAVLMLDIDHFKQVNDCHGHATGDLAIQRVALLAQRSLRAPDLLGRLGGEEFGILLPDTTQEEALATAERLRRAIAAEPLTQDGLAGNVGRQVAADIALTVSIGLTSLRPGETLESLCRRADAALYAAKRAGRNRVLVAEDVFSEAVG